MTHARTLSKPQLVKMSNVRKYLFHKKLFNIKDSPDLLLFENLMSLSRDCTLVCSCNLAGDRIHPCRYYVSCLRNLPGNLKMMLRYFKEASAMSGKKPDYHYLKELFDNEIDVAMLEFIVLGVDFRDDPEKSRFKIYVGVRDNNRKLQQLLTKMRHSKILEVMASPAFMFCVDMYFDGRKERKIYHTLTEADLKNAAVQQKLRKNFSDKVMKLIDRSCCVTISYSEGVRGAALNFQMDDFSDFLRDIKHAGIRKWHDAILEKSAGAFRIKDITLLEDEIDGNAISDVNLYYY